MKPLLFSPIAAAALFLLPCVAQAQATPATVALYKSKCAACHGPDGSASTPAGKTLGAHDFHSPDVQSQTDAQLTATVTAGKGKMPAYGKQLSDADLKALVAYVRELGQTKAARRLTWGLPPPSPPGGRAARETSRSRATSLPGGEPPVGISRLFASALPTV